VVRHDAQRPGQIGRAHDAYRVVLFFLIVLLALALALLVLLLLLLLGIAVALILLFLLALLRGVALRIVLTLLRVWGVGHCRISGVRHRSGAGESTLGLPALPMRAWRTCGHARAGHLRKQFRTQRKTSPIQHSAFTAVSRDLQRIDNPLMPARSCSARTALAGPDRGLPMTPLRSLLLTSLLALTPMLASAADKVTTTPVHFTKGASSATLRGTLSGYDTVRYTIAARAGQTMAVTIDGSPNANFNVFAPGVTPGQGEALGSNDEKRRWSGTLPTTGTYVVQVYQMRAQARRGEKAPHSLTVAIR